MAQHTIDPDTIELRRALKGLQEDVKAGKLTPKQANETLGLVADSLAAASSKKIRPRK